MGCSYFMLHPIRAKAKLGSSRKRNGHGGRPRRMQERQEVQATKIALSLPLAASVRDGRLHKKGRMA